MNRKPVRGRLAGAVGAVVGLAIAAGLIGSVSASDPPHWTSPEFTINCTLQCHTLHASPGGNLTADASNVNLCQSCHNSSGLAPAAPIPNAASAMPGTTGTSHAFGVPAVHGTYGTQLPQQTAMALRVMDGNIVCSTCHNQHNAESTNGGTPHITDPSRFTDLGSTGAVATQGTFTGSVGIWYLIEIDGTGSQADATFRWSKDNGASWMAQGVPAGNGAAVTLDDGVEVVLTGVDAAAFVSGERWQFVATYPFLRVPLDSGAIDAVDQFCRDCHRDWVMTHDTDLVSGGGVETWDGNFKSHPVGVGLNANGLGYDRPTPLDADGLAQGASTDTNPSNDLVLDASGNVQCLSCHGVHYADSNTLTVDAP